MYTKSGPLSQRGGTNLNCYSSSVKVLLTAVIALWHHKDHAKEQGDAECCSGQVTQAGLHQVLGHVLLTLVSERTSSLEVSALTESTQA